jgi:hypothetical protein
MGLLLALYVWRFISALKFVYLFPDVTYVCQIVISQLLVPHRYLNTYVLMLTGVLRSTKEGRPNIFSSRVSPRLDAACYVDCGEVFAR